MGLLFCKRKNKNKFLKEFNRVKEAIKKGVTPVFSEVRSAKTTLMELPFIFYFNQFY